mgnify:CR=1 FL=1|jgi:hypothetical protein
MVSSSMVSPETLTLPAIFFGLLLFLPDGVISPFLML